MRTQDGRPRAVRIAQRSRTRSMIDAGLASGRRQVSGVFALIVRVAQSRLMVAMKQKQSQGD